MKTVLLFILAPSVALLLCGTAFCSTPRHPGVAGIGDNPQEGTGSTQQTDVQAIQDLIQNAKGNLAIEKKWELDPLSRPKFNLIPAADIGKYRYTDRYLFDLDDAEISHYFILQEDYVFRNLNGRFDKIPAGFIWDGASIPKDWGAIGLEVGNTRYNSAIAEGLIHDYMYRNPQRYTKKEADDLFYDNLKRCKNPDAMAMYKGVDLHWEAAKTYRRHLNNQRQGYYDVFMPEFYAENLKIFQGRNNSSLEKKKVTTQQPDLHSLDLDDPNGDWCKCEERGEKPGCKANMDPVKGYVFFGCTKCKKVNVKYAKMALELEQKMKDAGVQGTWFGQNAKENAHKAASEPAK